MDIDNVDLGTMTHFEWMVPRRSAIQAELLRLLQVMERIKKPTIGRGGVDSVSALLLGAGFSLWRAVFIVDETLNVATNLEASKKFLRTVIHDNAVIYRDERNSWSLGFYLNNARYRLLRAHGYLKKYATSREVKNLMAELEKGIRGKDETGASAWDDTFQAMKLLLDALSDRVKDKVVRTPQTLARQKR